MLDASGDEEPVASPRALPPGTIIGRYHVLERVGAGGMGTVHAAYDPDLDRKVAIKLLHEEAFDAGGRTDGRAMLLREAQAMARLSHPNVVAVHDVGVHEGAVFLAMEFVHGRTVAEWIAERARSWREVLAVFVAAGRGLAAAHDAGLVHRDFKPTNVLVSSDGTVKVADFGLARTHGEAAIERGPTSRSAAVEAVIASSSAHSVSPTQTGAVMGWGGYMAPEQHLGLPIDARCDQFSFCVALYEALYGRRPFTASQPSALAVEVVGGVVEPAPAGSNVPAWLRELILRGLEPDPDRRFASMSALLAALSRDPNAARRRTLGIVAAVSLVGAGVFGISRLVAVEPPCSNTASHLAGVWDDDARERVRTGLFATNVGFAQSTWERVEPGLDAWAEAWIASRTDACAATQIRGEQSEALMDLRMECLDGRLLSLRALVGMLARADVTTLQNAVAAVADLPTLSACDDAHALREAEPRPEDPAMLAELEVLDGLIADAEQSGRVGKYRDALALAREVVTRAEPLGFAPTTARALKRRGSLEHTSGADAEAEETLQAAFFLAVRHRLDDIAASSATELVTVVGEVLQRPAEGRRWAAHASAHADAVGEPLLTAAIQHALAGVALREGAFDEARALATAALELRERELGEEQQSVLASLNMLGLIAMDSGAHDEAQAVFERELAIAERSLGPDHPELAKPINNLANLAWRQGKYDEARAAFERALVLQRDALGPEHRNVAQLENNIAAVAMSVGDLDEAERRFERALAIWRKALGDDHPQVADALNNLAVVEAARGDLEAARDYDERALAIRERTMPADHPGLAQNYANLGTDLFRLGRVDEARALHEKALAIYEAKLQPGSDDIALVSTALANDLLAQGDPDAALVLAERAFEIRKDAKIDPSELAQTRWALARALFDAKRGRDRARARPLAQQAREVFASAPPSPDHELPAVDAWLASH
jgi:tetratricopeptide (TPR) repeat protein